MNALFRIIGFPDIVVNCLHYNSISSARSDEPEEKTVTEGIALLVNPDEHPVFRIPPLTAPLLKNVRLEFCILLINKGLGKIRFVAQVFGFCNSILFSYAQSFVTGDNTFQQQTAASAVLSNTV